MDRIDPQSPAPTPRTEPLPPAGQAALQRATNALASKPRQAVK
jgi:hypothetical protein